MAMRPTTRNWRGVGATASSGPEMAATPPRSTTSVPLPGHQQGAANPLRPDPAEGLRLDDDVELQPDPWAQAPPAWCWTFADAVVSELRQLRR